MTPQNRPPDPADDPTEDSLAPELQTLLELDPEGGGDLPASDVAQICGNDRDKILGFIKTCSLEEISWRIRAEAAVERGDPDEAAASNHESQAWAATVHVLRAALRWVVLDNS